MFELLIGVIASFVGTQIYDLVYKKSGDIQSKPPEIPDPDSIPHLAQDDKFCDLSYNLFGELLFFIEQISVLYCEVFPIIGETENEKEYYIANPAEGRDHFLPESVKFLYRNYYKAPGVLRLEKDELDLFRFKSYKEFRNSISKDTIIKSSDSIHQLFTALLGHSEGSAHLLDSIFETVFYGLSYIRPETSANASNPLLADDEGNIFRFYTIAQSDRFIMTKQALEILTKSKDGKIKRRLKKGDRAIAHRQILAILSVTDLLKRTAIELYYWASNAPENKMDALDEKYEKKYNQYLFSCRV